MSTNTIYVNIIINFPLGLADNSIKLKEVNKTHLQTEGIPETIVGSFGVYIFMR